jgi:hypothetical protein
MKKIFLLGCIMMFLNLSFKAQVAINSDSSNPDSSAMLDVKSSNKGMLVPRMTTNQRTSINGPAVGLLVYDTDAKSFWFFGTTWQDLSSSEKLLDADSDTKVQVEESPDEDIIRFDVNGTEAMQISSSGHVGIGTTSPDTTLHVVGTIKMTDGTEGLGKVLASDSDGVSSWVDANDGLPVPDTTLAIPIRFQGSYIYVHPDDNGVGIDWVTAQKSCINLSDFGFNDWYLPNRLELDAMHKQSYLITGLSTTSSDKYWSISEFDVNNAYTQRLDYGGPDPDDKTDAKGHNCRCIRKN